MSNGFLFHTGVDEMTMAEYLKTARMTPAEREAWVAKYATEAVHDFIAEDDAFDAHSHHAEFGGAQH